VFTQKLSSGITLFVARLDVVKASVMEPRSVSISPSTKSFHPLPIDLTRIRCLCCGCGLDWHQPNARTPDRMLGIGLECGNWHLLDLGQEANDTVFVLLTVGRALRQVSVDPPPLFKEA